jgi:3-methyl-2-oxobutanoate hydroxymethyltransferase
MEPRKKVTLPCLMAMKDRGEKIAMVTAYDFPFAKIADDAGADIILVGDSLGTVVQGKKNTIPVTMEQMIYHTEMVGRAAASAFVLFDMPFMSYQESAEQARKNAGRALKETGAQAVKLEGGVNMKDTIASIVAVDIPVMGHVGFTPQSIHRIGGNKVQGREESARKRILADAAAVEEAGAFAIVLELVPAELAREITETLSIPTIGIGSGPDCDGQVLVMHDLLGLYPDAKFRFVKQYANLYEESKRAFASYFEEVKTQKFPASEHCFHRMEKVRNDKASSG